MQQSNTPAVRLFVGGNAGTIQGEKDDLKGDRMFTAAHTAKKNIQPSQVVGLLDSGAFSDPPHKRLTPDGALDRQMRWEQRASMAWGECFRAAGLVSYDLLIDEKWIAGEKHKRRWTIAEGDQAITETVAAAHYLASQRSQVEPRRLILSCQGVDAYQYAECTAEVLKCAKPHDWIGLGGWCIIGMKQAWMPTFWQTIRTILPQIKAAGVNHIHIFGVLFLKALGGLSWLADQHGLTVSTDSTAPMMVCTRADMRRSGARMPYWRDNVRWWVNTLANLRATPYYKEPPRLMPSRQESFL